jgi:hypothetical protein
MKNKTHGKTSVSALQVDENASLEEQVSRRAYELWQQRGGKHGDDLSDWLQAEREINEWHHRRRT